MHELTERRREEKVRRKEPLELARHILAKRLFLRHALQLQRNRPRNGCDLREEPRDLARNERKPSAGILAPRLEGLFVSGQRIRHGGRFKHAVDHVVFEVVEILEVFRKSRNH